MKHMSTIFAAVLTAVLLTGCLSPSGDTIQEQKTTASKMSVKGLDMIYERNPGLRNEIRKAAGYGVYKNIGIQWFVPSTESGWGIVHNNLTGKDTYMKLFGIGLGLGIGFRDFRGILVFDNQKSIKDFIDSGWGAHGQANAAFKFGETGGSAASAAEVMSGVKLYKVTVNGIVLQATFQGTKTWKNDKMNKK
jgi:lipid-binding SYLF domain-containing protein